MWSRWTKVLVIVQPQTVVRWHQAGFRLFWRWRSRRRSGRTPKDRKLIDLIRRMWQANPTWGSPRIRAELAKLGLQVSAATVRKYRSSSFHRWAACTISTHVRRPESHPSDDRTTQGSTERGPGRSPGRSPALAAARRLRTLNTGRSATPVLQSRLRCITTGGSGRRDPLGKPHRVSPRGCRMEFLSPTASPNPQDSGSLPAPAHAVAPALPHIFFEQGMHRPHPLRVLAGYVGGLLDILVQVMEHE